MAKKTKRVCVDCGCDIAPINGSLGGVEMDRRCDYCWEKYEIEQLREKNKVIIERHRFR